MEDPPLPPAYWTKDAKETTQQEDSSGESSTTKKPIVVLLQHCEAGRPAPHNLVYPGKVLDTSNEAFFLPKDLTYEGLRQMLLERALGRFDLTEEPGIKVRRSIGLKVAGDLVSVRDEEAWLPSREMLLSGEREAKLVVAVFATPDPYHAPGTLVKKEKAGCCVVQ